MPKGKIVLLISVIFILLIIILVIQFGINKNKSLIPFQPIQIAPQITLTPTSLQDFIVLSTDITEPNIQYSQFIKIKFTKEIVVGNIQFQLVPNEDINLLIDSDKQTLIIAPKNTWKIDQEYTIKIFKTTRSDTGQFLDKDYQFKFKTPPYTGI